MIPRPLTDAAARHNPGRWVCSKRPEQCDGTFWVYSQPMACPIRAKCFWGRDNTYERTPGPKRQGRFLSMDIDASWRREHGNRLACLQAAFAPELRKWAPTAEYKETRARKAREKRAAQRVDTPPPVKTILPCGEDCGNCPFDSCRYSDAAEDDALEIARRETQRQRSREKYRRQRAREQIDPEYAAHRRALGAARCKRYYDSHAEMVRAKARMRMQKRRKERAD